MLALSRWATAPGYILAFHPDKAIRLKTKNDAYPTATLSDSTDPKHRVLEYERLPSVNIHNIDFADTPFIVPSVDTQPIVINNAAKEARRHKNLVEVTGYRTALDLVKIDAGISPLTEVFIKRTGIRAVRLLDGSTPIQRWVGISYNDTRGLIEPAYYLAKFLKKYVSTFRATWFLEGDAPHIDIININKGDSAGISYKQWCDEFNLDEDWEAKTREDYPPREPVDPEKYLKS